MSDSEKIPPFEGGTEDEMRFWSAVVISVVNDSRVDEASLAFEWADEAVLARRERFGHR